MPSITPAVTVPNRVKLDINSSVTSTASILKLIVVESVIVIFPFTVLKVKITVPPTLGLTSIFIDAPVKSTSTPSSVRHTN